MSERRIKNDLIDKFLREELSEEELVVFKGYWNNDSVFVQEVRDYAKLKIALSASTKLEQENSKNGRVISWVRNAFFKYQSIAAVMLLAIMLPLYLLLQGQKVAITPESPELVHLANKYFVNSRLKDLSITANDIQNLKESIEDNQETSTCFILADWHFMNEQPDKAMEYYKLGLTKDSQNQMAHWNMLMSKLSTGHLFEVKEALKIISESEGSLFKEKANALELELH